MSTRTSAVLRGNLAPDQVDVEEERFHLVAQVLLRRQLHDVRERLEREGTDLVPLIAALGQTDSCIELFEIEPE